jgi:hypothetical protein
VTQVVERRDIVYILTQNVEEAGLGVCGIDIHDRLAVGLDRGENQRWWIGQALGSSNTRAGSMVQVVECLPSKREALTSNTSIIQKNDSPSQVVSSWLDCDGGEKKLVGVSKCRRGPEGCLPLEPRLGCGHRCMFWLQHSLVVFQRGQRSHLLLSIGSLL